MNWRASIEALTRNGYTKHDLPWCSYGKIESQDEALKRAESVFKKRKYSIAQYRINVYQSML